MSANSPGRSVSVGDTAHTRQDRESGFQEDFANPCNFFRRTPLTKDTTSYQCGSMCVWIGQNAWVGLDLSRDNPAGGRRSRGRRFGWGAETSPAGPKVADMSPGRCDAAPVAEVERGLRVSRDSGRCEPSGRALIAVSRAHGWSQGRDIARNKASGSRETSGIAGSRLAEISRFPLPRRTDVTCVLGTVLGTVGPSPVCGLRATSGAIRCWTSQQWHTQGRL
jgi:hypothetical protein